MWWARALDEHHEKSGERAEYIERRDADKRGRVMGGIRYARNRSGHNLASVLSFQPGRTFPVRFPTSWGDFKWQPISELPEPDRYKDVKGRVSYVAHLEGHPVQYALEDSKMWLVERAPLPD